MSFGMKGMSRDWGPGIVRVAGSFTVVSSNVSLSRPNRPGFTVVRRAAGIYQIQLTQAFLSVAEATVQVGPATAFGNAAVPTAWPSGGFAMITQDFFTATSTNLVPDATGKNLVIVTLSAPTGGSVVELAANYRCGFAIKLCESAVNK